MGKPRVIISSDIGGSDPDDDQSMVHALLYADKLDIEAIISTPTKHGGRASDIHQVIKAYDQDYTKLKTWSSEYPTPDYLKSIVHQGNINVAPSAGYSHATAGSNAIIKAAKSASSSDPVWVLTWGSMTDLAQALHDDPSIKSNIKVYSIGAWNDQQDPNARNYVYNNHKDLWWIENDSTFRGMYVDQNGGEKNAWKMGDAQGHGALGDFFHQARPWGLKMGDTPSLLYLLDSANNANPGASGWGGAFKQTGHGPNYWTDNPSSSLRDGSYNGSETVRVHQKEFYQDFANRLDRADKTKSGSPNTPPPNNTDDPVIAKNDTASTDKNKSVVVNVLQNDGAADGGLKLATVAAKSANGGKVVVNSDGTVTYTPKAGFTGADSFKYTAKDADGDTKQATVTVNVKAPGSPNTPPPTNGDDPVIANNDTATTQKGKMVVINALKNDSAADGGLRFSKVDSESAHGGKVSMNGEGTLKYTPKAGYTGTDTFKYTAKDADGDTKQATVTVNVKADGSSHPVPQPGNGNGNGNGNGVVAMDDNYTMEAGKKLYFNTNHILLNDKAGDGAQKASFAKSADGGLKATVASKSADGVKLEKWDDGTVIYKADKANGSDRIDYVLTDQYGNKDTASVLITIKNGVASPSDPTPPSNNPANPPQNGNNKGVVAQDDSYKIDAGETLYFNTRFVSGNDKGKGELNVVSVDAVSDRGVKISWGAEGTAKDGTLIYKSQAGFDGVDKINYKVVDKHGGYDIGTILINVNDLS